MVTEAGAREIHLNAYVDMPLDEVLLRFQAPDAHELLEAAIKAARPSRDEVLTVHATPPEQVFSSNARMTATWRITDRAGQINEGTAAVAFLMVQSGNEPLTEILVTMPVAGDIADRVVPLTRRFLDELAVRLSEPPG